MSSNGQNSQGDTCFPEVVHHPPTTLVKLLEIVNRDDRFNLLEDPTVLKGNLNNKIHPLFTHSQFVGKTRHIKQAVQLASLFLTTRPLLEYYIPLTYGVPIIRDAKSYRLYKGNDISRKEEIRFVESALLCLSHSLTWEWADLDHSRWAVTWKTNDKEPEHDDDCPMFADEPGEKYFFKSDAGVKIQVHGSLLAFYLNETTGYASRSRCEQFRHDFQVAEVLCHEIAHAYGAMAYNTLTEPYLSSNHPEKEFGFAWENFMFGSIIDPAHRGVAGTHVHMHKTWRTTDSSRHWGTLEWTPVPVAWTAQWFRTETWEDIKKDGHSAVELPDPIFKICYQRTIDRWIVYTDNEDVQEELELGRSSACLRYLSSVGGDFDALQSKGVGRMLWMPMNTRIKMPLMPTPQRHFDDPLENERNYIHNNKIRNNDICVASAAAKKKLKKPLMTTVAAGTIRYGTRTVKLGRTPKRLSVAGGPMSSSSSSESSSEEYVGDKPDLDIYKLFPPPNRPVTASRSSPSHTPAKRSRGYDYYESSPPNKKARRWF